MIEDITGKEFNWLSIDDPISGLPMVWCSPKFAKQFNDALEADIKKRALLVKDYDVGEGVMTQVTEAPINEYQVLTVEKLKATIKEIFKPNASKRIGPFGDEDGNVIW